MQNEVRMLWGRNVIREKAGKDNNLQMQTVWFKRY
jgi:hypothetical protein